jgi:hypothetical protein
LTRLTFLTTELFDAFLRLAAQPRRFSFSGFGFRQVLDGDFSKAVQNPVQQSTVSARRRRRNPAPMKQFQNQEGGWGRIAAPRHCERWGLPLVDPSHPSVRDSFETTS